MHFPSGGVLLRREWLQDLNAGYEGYEKKGELAWLAEMDGNRVDIDLASSVSLLLYQHSMRKTFGLPIDSAFDKLSPSSTIMLEERQQIDSLSADTLRTVLQLTPPTSPDANTDSQDQEAGTSAARVAVFVPYQSEVLGGEEDSVSNWHALACSFTVSIPYPHKIRVFSLAESEADLTHTARRAITCSSGTELSLKYTAPSDDTPASAYMPEVCIADLRASEKVMKGRFGCQTVIRIDGEEVPYVQDWMVRLSKESLQSEQM